MLAAFVAGFFFGMVIMRPADDPLSVERMSQHLKGDSATAEKQQPFFPGEPDEPVYEGPNWDLPGVDR